MLERDLGIAFTGGGRHEAWGTFNRLAFLGDTYLELIGVFDRVLADSATGSAVARATLAVLDGGDEGLATFALATDEIDGEVARLRAAGSSIGAPVDGSRARPDGEVVRWRTAVASVGPGEPPFLIEHEYAGAEWGDAARAARSAFDHPLAGRVRLTQLVVPCPDPEALADEYRGDRRARLRGSGWRRGSRLGLVRRSCGCPAARALDRSSTSPAAGQRRSTSSVSGSGGDARR